MAQWWSANERLQKSKDSLKAYIENVNTFNCFCSSGPMVNQGETNAKNKYDQIMPLSQTTDQPVLPRQRDTATQQQEHI